MAQTATGCLSISFKTLLILALPDKEQQNYPQASITQLLPFYTTLFYHKDFTLSIVTSYNN
jgi:hypothetical protein